MNQYHSLAVWFHGDPTTTEPIGYKILSQQLASNTMIIGFKVTDITHDVQTIVHVANKCQNNRLIKGQSALTGFIKLKTVKSNMTSQFFDQITSCLHSFLRCC